MKRNGHEDHPIAAQTKDLGHNYFNKTYQNHLTATDFALNIRV